jgi:hypothetical protein
MKKIIINFLVISELLFLKAGFSQNQYTIIEFDSTIGNIRDAIKLSNDEIIIVGNKTYVQGQPGRIFIAKINSYGEMIWKKEYHGGIPNYTDGFSVCAKTDGNFYIALSNSTKAILIETNQLGDSIWSFVSSEPELYPKYFGTIKEFSDNSLVLSELIYDADPIPYIFQSNYYILNPDGTISLKFEAENYQVFDLQVISENEFIAAEIGDYGSKMLKYNINGQSLSIDACSNYPQSDYCLWELSSKSEDGFYCTGHFYYPLEWGLLSKLNENGQTEFCAIDTSLNYLLGCVKTSDGQIIYFGGTDVPNELVVGQFTDWGSFIPKITINNIYVYHTTADLILANDNLLIFSRIFNYNFTTVMIKIPVNSVVSSIATYNFNLIKIFPNPVRDKITITTPQGEPIKEAIIYNHLGQKVLTKKPVNNTVDVSKLKPGIYFIEVATTKWRGRTKLVKE